MGDWWKLNCIDQLRLFISFHREVSKIFNTPPASRVAHITRDFLICKYFLIWKKRIQEKLKKIILKSELPFDLARGVPKLTKEFEILLCQKKRLIFSKTNSHRDVKICWSVHFPMKILPWNFCFLKTHASLDVWLQSLLTNKKDNREIYKVDYYLLKKNKSHGCIICKWLEFKTKTTHFLHLSNKFLIVLQLVKLCNQCFVRFSFLQKYIKSF